MAKTPKKIKAHFFQTAGGAEPVREWLKALDAEDRKAIGYDIATVEYGWPIGMPICRALGEGLFEVRSNLSSKRIARVLFCATEGRLVLLHGFIKKTQKTPKTDLVLARARKKEIKQ